MGCAAFLKKESLVNTISTHALMASPSTRPLLHARVASGLLPFQALFARNQVARKPSAHRICAVMATHGSQWGTTAALAPRNQFARQLFALRICAVMAAHGGQSQAIAALAHV